MTSSRSDDPIYLDDICTYNENLPDNSAGRVPESRKNFLQELVGCLHRPKLSKWCFYISIAVVIAFITALVIYTDYDTSPQPHLQSLKTPFLKDYFLYRILAPNLFNGTFISGKDFYYYDSERNLAIMDLTKMKSNVIVPAFSKIMSNGTFQFWFSEDLQYMMFAGLSTQVYRHSYNAIYQIYNLKSGETNYITQNSLQLAVIAPKTNAIAYVLKNNIFYRADPEDESADVQLTFDGISGQLYNGNPDWVYEEEILASNKAMWFSNNARYLAYFKFNDTYVIVQAIPVYGPPNDRRYIYPHYDQIHYPKVGTPNPIVSVHVVDLTRLNPGQRPLEYVYEPPQGLPNNMQPIPSLLAWANDTHFVVVWMDRYQNTLIIELCDAGNSSSAQIIFQKTEHEGWLQLEAVRFDAAGKRMVFIWWHLQTSGDSYPHVTMINLANVSAGPLAITSGLFSVVEIVGWNQETDEVFFLATSPGESEKLGTYKVQAHSPNNVTCLSCNRGVNCSYAGAVVSNSGQYFALSCAGPDVPNVTLCDAEGKELLVWEENERISSLVKRLPMPVKKIINVPLEDNFTARVQLLLPYELANIDNLMDYQGKKYPLLVNVYAGPDSSLVKDMFSSDFNTFIVANKSVVGVAIDGRGSNLLGQKARYSVYKKLGQYEIADQLAVIKYLQETYPFIDANHTASWGWSYGGYATGMMLAEDKENRIKCGVSIAPVTDWTYYDSIYTERFMQSLTENLEGYMASSLLNKASRLKNKEFFLIHGTKDDNVHYQNSMQLAKILSHSDIPFRQITYPDEDHGLQTVQPHFYHAIEDFLDECFSSKSL